MSFSLGAYPHVVLGWLVPLSGPRTLTALIPTGVGMVASIQMGNN